MKGIADVAAANAYVIAEYLPQHNARFAIAPAHPADYHRPRDRRRWADADVFSLETPRAVSNDLVVQYKTQALQLDRRLRGRVPPKSQVLVRELRDGTLRVVAIGRDGSERVLPWSPAASRLPKPQRIPESSSSRPAAASPPRRSIPAPDHPWRQHHRRWQEEALTKTAREPAARSAAAAPVADSASLRSASPATGPVR